MIKVSEEWVDEDKLELWEVRQYGERAERITPVTRQTTGKLPQRNIAPTPPNAADLKDKMEQQLREQRAAHQQKRALEMSQGLLFKYQRCLCSCASVLYKVQFII